jgi:hypothetical protein
MSIFTSEQLDFLASLKTGWGGLYRSELARLLKDEQNSTTYDDSHPKLLEEFLCFGSRYSSPR